MGRRPQALAGLGATEVLHDTRPAVTGANRTAPPARPARRALEP